jgi:hypothetical protein
MSTFRDAHAPADGWYRPWFPISGPTATTGTPVALSRFGDHLDVFWCGSSPAVWTTWWDAMTDAGRSRRLSCHRPRTRLSTRSAAGHPASQRSSRGTGAVAQSSRPVLGLAGRQRCFHMVGFAARWWLGRPRLLPGRTAGRRGVNAFHAEAFEHPLLDDDCQGQVESHSLGLLRPRRRRARRLREFAWDGVPAGSRPVAATVDDLLNLLAHTGFEERHA